jgi:hypothetical protein
VWIINVLALITKSTFLIILGPIISFVGNAVGFLLTPLVVIYSFLAYENIKKVKLANGDNAQPDASGDKIKLLIVGILGIILVFGGIFASIVLVALNNAKGKAMDAARQADISQLRSTLEIYAMDHNDEYPRTLEELNRNKGSLNSSPNFLDPKTKLPYEYRILNNGEDFELCARLESGARKCVNGYGNY